MIEEIIKYINENPEKIVEQLKICVKAYKNDIKNYFLEIICDELERVKDQIKYKEDIVCLDDEGNPCDQEDYPEIKSVTDWHYIVRYDDEEYEIEYDYVSPDTKLTDYLHTDGVRPFDYCDIEGQWYLHEFSEFINSLLHEFLKKYLERIFNIHLSDDEYSEILEYTDYYLDAYDLAELPPMFNINTVMEIIDFEDVPLRELV